MAPITWRNVSAPNFSGSNQLQVAATNQLNQALNQVGGAFGQFAKGRADNQQKVTDLNTQDLVNKVQGLRNMDEYAGAGNQFSQAALQGQNIDVGKVLGAYEGRENTLQSDFVDDNNFATAQRNIAENPIKAAYNTEIANASSPAEYAAIQERLAQETGLQDASSLINSAKQGSYASIDRSRANTAYNRKETDYANEQNLGNLITEQAKTQILAGQRKTGNSARFADQFNTEFGSPMVQVDGVGNIMYNQNATQEDQKKAQDAYNKFSADNPVETINFQEQASALIAAPGNVAQKSAALNNLLSFTNSRQQLPAQGQNQIQNLAESTTRAGARLKDAYETDVAKIKKDNPLELPETEFTQQVAPEVALDKLLSKAPNDKIFAYGEGGQDLTNQFDALRAEGHTYRDSAGKQVSIEYPGVVLARAADLVPVNQEWLGGDAISIEDYEKILNREMMLWRKEKDKYDTVNSKIDSRKSQYSSAENDLLNRASKQKTQVFSKFGVSQ